MRTTLRTTLMAMAALLGLAGGGASAAPLNVAEGVLQDLFGNTAGARTLVGALDVGVNAITGHLNCAGSRLVGCVGDNGDFIRITVPAYLDVRDISFTVTSFSRTGNVIRLTPPFNTPITAVQGRLTEASAGLTPGMPGFTAPITGTGTTSVFSGFGNGPGTIDLAVTAELLANLPLGTVLALTDLSYRIDITVVPEPAGMAVFGLGLAGFGAVLLRRRPRLIPVRAGA